MRNAKPAADNRRSTRVLRALLIFPLVLFCVPLLTQAQNTTTTGSATTTAATTTGKTIKVDFKLNVPIPGLVFSSEVTEANGYLDVPLLAQYIAAVYRYLTGVAIVAAAVMIVYGGFRYIVGSSIDSIQQGKKIIADATIGLILLLGTYTVLATLSPTLLTLKPLKLLSIQQLQLIFEETMDHTPENASTRGKSPPAPDAVAAVKAVFPDGVPTPAVGAHHATGNPICTSNDTCRPLCGSVGTIERKVTYPDGHPPSTPFYQYPLDRDMNDIKTGGLIMYSGSLKAAVQKPGTAVDRKTAAKSSFASNSFAEGIERAAKIAFEKGYLIVVQDTVRSVASQLGNACRNILAGDAAKEAGDMNLANNFYKQLGTGVGLPGASPHEIGIASDMSLWKDGVQIVCAKCGDEQKQEKYRIPSAIFDAIMTAAGAERQADEVWHWEFGGPGGVSRCQYPKCLWPPNPYSGGILK